MVHCRNWNFSGFVPEEGLVLEVTWQKHRNLESRAEHPWSSLSAAPKDAPPSPGLQRDQPQALSALPSPKPHCCSQVPTGMGTAQAHSKMMELEVVRCLHSLLYPASRLEILWKKKGISLLSALCCGWAPAPGWRLLRSSDTTKRGKLQKASAIYSV